MAFELSHRAKRMRKCLMDEFHLRTAKDVIFFNSGQPAEYLYPTGLLMEELDFLLQNNPSLLAYPTNRGDDELIRVLIERMERLDIAHGVSPEQIFVTNGGTGAADLIGQLFIDRDSLVLTETPTFPETLDAFYKAGAHFDGIGMDEDGPIPQLIEEKVKKEHPVFFYAIPDFQNPTGRVTTLKRRREIIELARKYGFFILEDDPYRELWFDHRPPATYYSLAPERVIYMSSLSKTVAPGMRTGWVIMPTAICPQAEMMQKAVSLGYPALPQRALARMLSRPEFDNHVKQLRRDLKKRCSTMSEMLKLHVPSELLNFTEPEGGMFLWCDIPECLDAMKVARECRDKDKVILFPGVCFTPDYKGLKHSLRLTFARPGREDMKEGARRIGQRLKLMRGNKN